MGLPSKVVTASDIFKNHLSSLAHNLISKLPLLPNMFIESKIASFFDNNTVAKDLNLQLSEMPPE